MPPLPWIKWSSSLLDTPSAGCFPRSGLTANGFMSLLNMTLLSPIRLSTSTILLFTITTWPSWDTWKPWFPEGKGLTIETFISFLVVNFLVLRLQIWSFTYAKTELLMGRWNKKLTLSLFAPRRGFYPKFSSVTFRLMDHSLMKLLPGSSQHLKIVQVAHGFLRKRKMKYQLVLTYTLV